MKHRTLNTSIKQRRNTINYTEIRGYFTEAGRVQHRFRAHIQRDFYEDQSYANIEKWSDENGWLLIASQPITEFACASIRVGTPITDDCVALLSESSDQLFLIGETFMNF